MKHPFVVLVPLLMLACGTGVSSTSGGLQICTSAADCAGALPTICPPCPYPNDRCASFACVEGLCRVVFCTPSQQCNTASDCTGVLPTYCQVCADGSTACAHWVCSSGGCVIGVCP